MSFVSLPHSFGDAQAKASTFQIAKVGTGGLEPVGTILLEESLPVEGEKLAANLAALLNGNNPLYRFGGDSEMYFQKLGDGRIAFRFRPVGVEGGVSTAGATVVMLPGLESLLDEAVNPESKAFQFFMDAGNKEERRTAPRTEASGDKGRGHTPKGGVPSPSF